MARSTRRRRLLVALGVVGGVAGVALIGLGAGVAWLSSPAGNRWIAKKALAAADAALPGELSVGALDTNVLRFIELEDVSLTDLEGDAVVTIERVRLDYRLHGIFARRLVVPSIEIVRPRIDLQVRPDGQLDLLAALGVEPTPPDAPEEPPSAWSGIGDFTVAVERLALSNGSVRYRDPTNPDAPVEVALRDISVGGAATVSDANVEVPRLALIFTADAPVETPASIELEGAYEAGDVRIDSLVVGLEATRLTGSGRVRAVETAPEFDLSLDLPRVDAAEVNRLIGDEIVSASPALSLRATGPLDALVIAARLTGEQLGAIDLVGGADLTATPLSWRVAFETPRFDLQPLLPAITEPVVIDGRWAVDGEGVGWPDDLVARFEVDAGEPTLWGEPLRDLLLRGRVDGGVVLIERLEAAHPLGTLRADGTVAVTDSSAVVQVSARVPTLAALRRFDVEGFVGSADFDGTVRASWAAEPVRVEAKGQLRGRGLAMPESEVSLATLSVPLSATVVGERVDVRGTMVAGGLQAPSAALAELRLPSWNAQWSPATGAVAQAELVATGIDVGDGAVTLESIFGTAGGGADAQNVPFASADVIMSDMVFGSSGVQAEGGPVEMRLDGSALTAEFSLDRREDAFFQGNVTGDLAGGDWTVDGLVLAPTAGKPWRAPRPVTFVLADGGVRSLELALQSSSGSLIASGDWVGPTSEGTNLTLGIESLVLADVAQIAQTYVPAEPDASPLLEGLAGTLDLDLELSDWAGEQGAGIELDVAIAELRYPGAVQGVDLDVGVGGSLGRPRGDLNLSTAKLGELVVGEVAVPLRLQGGLPVGLDCDGDADLLVMLTPGALARISAVVPDLELPEGELSAALSASASPCDPDLHLTGAAQIVAGTRGQRVRFDLDAMRLGDDVTLAAVVFEQQRRRLALEGSATTRLSQRLAELLPPSESAPPAAGAPTAAAPAPAEAADPSTLSAWIERFDVSLVPVGLPLSTLGLFAEVPTGVRGLLGGGLNLSGTPSEPTMSGALLLVDGHLGSVPLSQAQVLLFPGPPPEGGAMGYHVEGHFGFGRDASAGSLDLIGHLPLALDLDRGADQALDRPGFSLALSGDGLPLEVLPGVVAGVPEASGLLELEATVAGTMLDPEFTGSARMDGAKLTATDLGIEYRDIGLDLSVEADRMRLNKLRADAIPVYGALLQGTNSTSRVSLAGSMLMDRFTPTSVQAHLSATDLWLISTDDYQVRANARMDVDGDWPSLKVKGETELVQGRVSLPDSVFREGSSLELDPILTIHRKRAIGGARQPAPNPLMENLVLDLQVDLHRGLQLLASVPTLSDYGQQFAELSSVEVDVGLSSPSLGVRSKGADVQVNGTLEMDRGALDIMGRSFDVGGGSVSFVSDVTDPILDVSATHRTGQYGDITVDVGGSVSDLQLDFSSEQYPDKTDVMAILLLGKPTSEMSSTDGDMGSSLLSAAVGSVASNLSKTVSSSFLGQIEIDSDSFKMGFPVGRDIFGTVELRSTEDDDENSIEVTLEWLLSRRLSAELVTGDAAQTSADIYYRWRF